MFFFLTEIWNLPNSCYTFLCAFEYSAHMTPLTTPCSNLHHYALFNIVFNIVTMSYGILVASKRRCSEALYFIFEVLLMYSYFPAYFNALCLPSTLPPSLPLSVLRLHTLLLSLSLQPHPSLTMVQLCRHVVLVSADKDGYVPPQSARVQMCDTSIRDAEREVPHGQVR